MARKSTNGSSRSAKVDSDQLTERQLRILQVIRDAVVLRGYPPSIREIGDAAGLQSTSSVAYQLKELERKGYLRRDPNKPRAVDVRTLPGEEVPRVGPKPRHLPQASQNGRGHLTRHHHSSGRFHRRRQPHLGRRKCYLLSATSRGNCW